MKEKSLTYIKYESKFLLKLVLLIWIAVSLLYSMYLSDLLEHATKITVFSIGLSIPFFFFIGYFIAKLVFFKRSKDNKLLRVNMNVFKMKVKKLSLFFVLIVFIEFAYERFIPLISMMRGGSLSHFDFGIPSLHGLLMSLGALLFTSWYFIYHIEKRRVSMIWMFSIITLFILLVTRKMMVICIFQTILLSLTLRTSNTVFFKYIFIALIILIIFGILGDIRTGRELFLSLSHFTIDYPEWLPTGFGWIYIYITTPLANLINAMQMDLPVSYDLDFIQGLFPSIIRNKFFTITEDNFGHVWQVSGAFNIGTGFMAIYLSLGYIGFFIFNVILGFTYRLIELFSFKIGFFLLLIVFSSCTLLLIFSNNFFNLNTASQMLFSYIFFGIQLRLGVSNNE